MPAPVACVLQSRIINIAFNAVAVFVHALSSLATLLRGLELICYEVCLHACMVCYITGVLIPSPLNHACIPLCYHPSAVVPVGVSLQLQLQHPIQGPGCTYLPRQHEHAHLAILTAPVTMPILISSHTETRTLVDVPA